MILHRAAVKKYLALTGKIAFGSLTVLMVCDDKYTVLFLVCDGCSCPILKFTRDYWRLLEVELVENQDGVFAFVFGVISPAAEREKRTFPDVQKCVQTLLQEVITRTTNFQVNQPDTQTAKYCSV